MTRKYISIVFLTVLIVPSIALASWWNPFTWKIFQKSSRVQIEQPIIATSSSQVASTTNNTTTQSTEVKKINPITPKPKTPSISNTVSKPNDSLLQIEKCKAQLLEWQAIWPILEQKAREKGLLEYQNYILSLMSQGFGSGVITAGDLGSSTSSMKLKMQQDAVNKAKIEFDLAGSSAYQECLTRITN